MTDTTIPPIPSLPSLPEAAPDAAAAKAKKAARDKAYRERKAAPAPKVKAKAAPAPKVKAKAAPAPKVKAKAAPAPKVKAKAQDARTMPRSERPDTDALILKTIAKRPHTARQLHESGKFDYLKLSGVQESLKRLYARGLTDAVETAREGRDGRPPFAYRAK